MKINCIAIAVCLGLVPLASASAAAVEQTLKFKAAIPDEDFTITPETPWPTDDINLAYHDATQEINSYNMSMSIVSKTHDIMAKLGKDPLLSLDTDENIGILMNVSIDGAALNTFGRKVHTRAPLGRTHNLSIRTHYPASRYPAGTYTGNIVLIFDVE